MSEWIRVDETISEISLNLKSIQSDQVILEP